MNKSQKNKTALAYAKLEFDAQNTPSSVQHQDVYFSRGQGIAESRYVFLQHNHLPARWHTLKTNDTWVIAETGFGTGLNFYIAATEFLEHAPKHTKLHFVSFEKHPLRPNDLAKVARHWPEFETISTATQQHYPDLLPGLHRLQLHSRITLDLILGDASETLPDWAAIHQHTVDTWFLDGFAPSKNPTMWTSPIYRAVFRSLKANGTLATFTASGHVRRDLSTAGLRMKKAPGFRYKREMLYGTKQSLALPKPKQPRSIAIIGGGIAAACVATELRDFPGELRLIWATEQPADAASGNPQAGVYPLLQAKWDVFSEFYTHSFGFARPFYQQHVPNLVHWTGVELIERSIEDTVRQKKIINRALYPAAQVQGREHSIFMPKAGWLSPIAVVTELFKQLINYREQRDLPTYLVKGEAVRELRRETNQWCIQTNRESYQAEHAVLCMGHSNTIKCSALKQAHLPIRPVRGQVTLLKQGELSNLKHVMCEKGYVLPPQKGVLCTGATFEKGNATAAVTASDNEANIEQLNRMLNTQFNTEHIVASRASVRATTPDHLPIHGQLVRASLCGKKIIPCSGLWIISGLGSRGFTTAPWLAHALACEILSQPRPCGERLAQATGANRFLQRHQAKSS